MLQEAMTRHDVKPEKIAASLHQPVEQITIFSNGDPSPLDIRKVTQAATVYVYERDESMLELERLAQGNEWMRTLTQPYMTFGRSLSYLRLAEARTKIDFAKRAQSGITSQSEYEAGIKPPQLSTLERMIETSVLDTDSKAAQLLRLRCKGEEALTDEQLKTITLGKLIKYLRILKGANQKILGKALGYDQDAISKIERGITREPLVGNTLNSFIEWLELPKDSALEKVIKQKAEKPKEEIDDALIQEAVLDKYLFKEHFQTITHYPLTATETNLLKRIVLQGISFGQTLAILIKRTGKSQANFAESHGMRRDDISHIINEKNIPEDYMVARLLSALGYTIHHPLTHYLLNITEIARAEKEQKVRPWQTIS